MAVHNLPDQFGAAQCKLNLGRRRAVAQAAHLEVRSVLNGDAALLSHGLHDVLIGSYARDTGIWPGKDVDIFGKLTRETIDSLHPEAAYRLFLRALEGRYEGRLTEQPRSIKINFGPDDRAPALQFLRALEATTADVFEFSVDVVPAVRWGGRWAIPNRDRELWLRSASSDRWVRTDPEVLNDLTTKRNDEPSIGGQGAFVPTVKAIKQIRRHHPHATKPGGLFYEFALHEGFAGGHIEGESWADITAGALRFIANRLRTADSTPVCDPVLEQPYAPAPDPSQLSLAASTFDSLARGAEQALVDDRCPAAAAWRAIFGNRINGDEPVFPLPPGCRADGSVIVPSAGPNVLRGSDEARGFGAR